MIKLLTSPTAALSLVLRSALFLLSLGKHFVSNNIGSESNDGDAEAMEYFPEHCCILEYCVFAPRLTLGPRVTE